MTTQAVKSFVTWPFIMFLAILIANDNWLKSIYPGLITGKLSDISGIAVVTIPILAAFQKKYFVVAVSVSVAFLWWKSPASGAFINWVNSTQVIHISRVIDYSDLIALTVIPVCRYVVSNMEKLLIPLTIVRQVAVIPVVMVTFFALLGTSQMPHVQKAEIFSKSPPSGMNAKRISEVFSKLALEYGLECVDCRQLPQTAIYQGRGFTVSYEIVRDSVISLRTQSYTNFPFPGRGGRGRVEEFMNAVKYVFAREFPSLTYSEQLN